MDEDATPWEKTMTDQIKQLRHENDLLKMEVEALRNCIVAWADAECDRAEEFDDDEYYESWVSLRKAVGR